MFRNSNNLLRRVNKPAEKHPDILRYEELEQRVLFSADVIPGVDMPAADEQVVIEDVSGGTQAEPEASAETADQAASESRLELVFVNENVPDYDLLISGLEGGDANRIIELVILDPGRDGIEQVSEILAQRSDLAAVHFISHGADGQINLGNTFLNHNTLQLNSEAVAGWGDALTDSGDFLFYGCNIAADDAGQSLLNDIAALAGVDVAASEDPTGHESLGGDWDLEYASGAIETESPVGSDAQESWIRLLGEHTISDNFAYSGSPYNNSDGTDEWSSSWEILSGVGGYDAVIFDGSKLSIGGDDAVDDIVDYGVKRQADLPVAVSATLSLDVVFSGGEQHGFGVSLEVSSTGEDGSWVTLNTFYLNSDLSTLQDPISFQEDISSYCGGTIWVRLLGIQEGDDSDFDPLGDSASIDFHNLQIAYTTTNDAPVIDSAALTVIEGQTVALSDADFGITDPDDSNFTYTLSGISGGYFQLSSNVGVAITTFTSADLTGGLVQFVDDGNEVAPAFSVTVNDGDSDSNTFAATITYTAANDEPLLAAIANQSVDEGATLTFTASASDADLPADTLTYSLDATSTAAGMTINASTGTFSWSPTEAQNGDHSVTVTVSDGDLSDSETFTITVNEVNTAPVLDSASLTLNEGETFTLGGANFGITDPDDTAFTYTVSSISGGYFQLSSNVGVAIITFTSADLAGGLAQFVDDGNETAPAFSVTVNDGDSDSNTLAANITYTATNDDPVATDDTLATNEDTPLTITTATDLLSNDSDVDGDSPTITLFTQPANGTVLDNGDGTWTYTPAADFYGSDTFTYEINDANGGTDTATITITVMPVNDSATFGGDTSGSGSEDAGDITGILIVSDAADGVTTPNFTVISAATNGTAAIDNSTGAWTYSPGADFNGSDSFTVQITDDDGNNETQVISITVTPANDAPVLAAIGNQSVDEGATLTFTASASDADLPADTLTYSLDATSTAAGMTINASTGEFSWSPAEAQNGDYSVTVTVSDGDLSGSETFTITVNEVNTAPVLDSASLTLNEGETFTLGGANFGITDPDDSSFTYALSGISGGYFQLSSNVGVAIITFTSADLAGGLAQFVDDGNETAPAFSVTVNDGDSDSNTLAATITYTATNDAPVIDNVSLTINEGETVTLGGANFGITDPDDTAFTYTVSSISGGYFQLSSNVGVAIITFTSADLAGGMVQFVDDGNELPPAFNVTVNDGHADSSTLAATITYTAANDAPTFDSVAVTTATEDIAYNYSISTSDVDGDGLTITATTLPGWLTFTDNGDGTATLSGMPGNSEVGNHNITLQTSDGTVNDTQNFTLSVSPAAIDSPADNPVANDNGGGLADWEAISVKSETGDNDIWIAEKLAYDHPYEHEVMPMVEEYSPYKVSQASDNSIVQIQDLEAEETEQNIYLGNENGGDDHSKRHGNTHSYIYFDNNLFKEITSTNYPDFNHEVSQNTLEPNKSTPFETNNIKKTVVNEDYNQFEKEIDEAFKAKQHDEEVKAKIVAATMATFSVGIVTYLLRAGSMIAGLMSTLPLWRGFDPIVILAGHRKKQKKQNITPAVDKSKTENLFKGKEE